MALDGAFLRTIKLEIEKTALNSRVDKIHQPSKDEIVIHFRCGGGIKKLLLNANASTPRVHFTNIQFENPNTPPMFCMLLRKHLQNAKLTGVRQYELDRILFLDFLATNELGDPKNIVVVIEIMGRHSNIIMVNSEGKIVDAIKRISDEVSSVRRVLPGITYETPPLQDKINLENSDVQKVEERLETQPNVLLSKALLNSVLGFSPILAREIAYMSCKGEDIHVAQLTDLQKEKVKYHLSNIKKIIETGHGDFTIILENSKPKDFCLIEIHQYGVYVTSKKFSTPSELLDSFYAEKDTITRMKQKSNDLLKMLVNTSERILRKLENQKLDYEKCKNREELKICGELINANLYQLKKGMESCVLYNFYDDNEKEIALDPQLTPSQNAQKYYNEYRKAATAEKMLKTLIEQGSQEYAYIESVFDAVSRASTEAELTEIREELSSQHYIRRVKSKHKPPKPLPPIKYISSDGFTILCGRNNIQNDKLTTKTAKNYDIWFHTHNIPGSHVIVITDGKEVPNKTLEEACIIAATNSKAKDSKSVPVDYTIIKNVKKPNGAKPGMVIFENNKTAFVNPDADLINKLMEK